MAAVKELLIELQEKYSVLDINEMMYPTPEEPEIIYLPIKVNVYGLFNEPFSMEVSHYDMNTYERTEILEKYFNENNVIIPKEIEYRVERVEDNGNGLDWCEEDWFVLIR